MVNIGYTENVRGKYDVYIENGLRFYVRFDLTDKQRDYFIKKLIELLNKPAECLAWGNL